MLPQLPSFHPSFPHVDSEFNPPLVIGALVAALEKRMMDNRLGFILRNGGSHFTRNERTIKFAISVDHTGHISKCKEDVRVLVFLASVLYGTLAFLMEVKEQP